MKISEVSKRLAYGIVFGFMGLIIGIWTADLIHKLILMNNVERMITTYISLIIIILIIISASLFGFTKGEKLMEEKL
ncbi:MAG: hypothetical protein OIN66_07515 [Candidatus Methanoperedens sp.]|nr:hypothetical protein [Candidatus Methanoperedens sp.]